MDSHSYYQTAEAQNQLFVKDGFLSCLEDQPKVY